MSVPTIILCGGRGSRISEVDPTIPKPLLPVGDRPVLWHIMKIYATYGHTDFALALGYMGEEIRKFFLNYKPLTRDFVMELGSPELDFFPGSTDEDSWKVACIDTGRDSLTATRVRVMMDKMQEPGPVMVTYGDCLADVNVDDLLDFHRSHGKLATITAVRPPGRFGELLLDDILVEQFDEKPDISGASINGGYMVFEKEAIDRFFPTDRDVMLEDEPMRALVAERELAAYRHHGFWQPMDTPRERALLHDMWMAGNAPWKIWDEGFSATTIEGE